MRRFLVVLALPLALLGSKAAFAQSAPKYGYVDVQRAVQEVEEGKAARTRLQGELNDRRQQIEKKKTDLEKMQGDFSKQSAVLSEDAKKKKMEEMQKAYIDTQTAAQQMQEELSAKEQEAMGRISRNMIQIVSEVAERDGFTFVFDKAVLLFAPPSSEITNEVVRRYNDKFPNAAGAAASSAKKEAGEKKASAPKK
ncbi:MAG: OmpH family outer membrane protein [Deltaproteobacteria bacterium]|nr:OmpH family outer membrane protein [Deltaproteobacteria bacterium]